MKGTFPGHKSTRVCQYRAAASAPNPYNLLAAANMNTHESKQTLDPQKSPHLVQFFGANVHDEPTWRVKSKCAIPPFPGAEIGK